VPFGSHSDSIYGWISYLQVWLDITATQRASPELPHAEQANLGTSGGKEANPKPHMDLNLIFSFVKSGYLPRIAD